MLKTMGPALVALVLVGTAGQPAYAGELKLSIQDGLVTLSAESVPVRQILAEWARVGQTKVVNGEKLGGPPVTLQLNGVPENQALEIILRSASGYVVAARAVSVPGASQFDRILIMPAASAPALANATVRPQPPLGSPQRPIVLPRPAVTEEEDTDEEEVEEEGNESGDEDAEAESISEPNALRPGMMPGAQQGNVTGVPGSSRPGVVAAPPQQPQFRNPYGIAAPVTPGAPTPVPPTTLRPPFQPNRPPDGS